MPSGEDEQAQRRGRPHRGEPRIARTRRPSRARPARRRTRPGRASRACSPSTETSAVPSRMTKKSRPRLHCSTTVSPGRRLAQRGLLGDQGRLVAAPARRTVAARATRECPPRAGPASCSRSAGGARSGRAGPPGLGRLEEGEHALDVLRSAAVVEDAEPQREPAVQPRVEETSPMPARLERRGEAGVALARRASRRRKQTMPSDGGAISSSDSLASTRRAASCGELERAADRRRGTRRARSSAARPRASARAPSGSAAGRGRQKLTSSSAASASRR